MNITKQDIFNALSNVIDPIGGKDIVSSNFFKTLEVDGLNIKLQIELPPATHSIINQQEIKQLIIAELHKSISEDLIFDFPICKRESRTFGK